MLYTFNFKIVSSRAVHYNALRLNNLFILTSLCSSQRGDGPNNEETMDQTMRRGSSFVVFLIQVLKFLRSSILQLLSLHLLLIDVQLLFLCLYIILCLSNPLNYMSMLALHQHWCFCCQGFLKVCPHQIISTQWHARDGLCFPVISAAFVFYDSFFCWLAWNKMATSINVLCVKWLKLHYRWVTRKK